MVTFATTACRATGPRYGVFKSKWRGPGIARCAAAAKKGMCLGNACSACSDAGCLRSVSVIPILPYAYRHDPRQEPDEVILHVRTRAGGAEQSASLPRPSQAGLAQRGRKPRHEPPED